MSETGTCSTSVSFRYTSTWLKSEWSQLFTYATGVSVTIGSVSVHYFRAYELICAGEIEIRISGSGQDEFYRTTRVERFQWLAFYPTTFFDTSLHRWYGEQVEFALHPLARLSVYKRHPMRIRPVVVVVVWWDWSKDGLQFVLYASSAVQFVLYVCLEVGVWRED